MSFELIHSETLMKGRAFTIRRDTMKTPDGRETYFDIVEHVGSFFIIPVDDDGILLFVLHYRHASAPGYSTEYMGGFLATDLKPNPLEADADEFLSVEKIPVKQALQMAEHGDMPDAKTLAALLMAKSTLETHPK